VLRRILLAASASDRVRQFVTTAPYTRGVVARFVAGDTADDAIGVTRRLLADGLLVSLDYLGEDTADPDQAAAVADEYVGLLGGSARPAWPAAAGPRSRSSPPRSASACPSAARRPPPATSRGSALPPATRAPRSPWTWRTTPGSRPRCASWPSSGRISPTSAA
jgi:hypothetical protein